MWKKTAVFCAGYRINAGINPGKRLCGRWMLCKKPWIVPIPGTRKLERLKENAGAAEVKLTAQEVQKLDGALNHMEMSEVFGGSRIVKSKNAKQTQ